MTEIISGSGQEIRLSANLPAGEAGAKANLLAGLPAPLRAKVQQLLQVKHNQCGPARPELPRNCYETAAFVAGLEFAGLRRGPAVGHESVLDEQEKIREMLARGGFRKTETSVVFRVGRKAGSGEKIIVGANLRNIPKNLKAGDLIMFGGWSYDEKGQGIDKYTHAAVYLGRFRGKDYIFEKENKFCGPQSPYRINTLEAAVKGLVGLPEVYDGVYLDSIFVLRK